MIVEPLSQRLRRAEGVSIAVTSPEEAQELVAWTLNDRFTYEGVDETGVFLFKYYELGASWWWDLRSDNGCYMVRFEPATRPETPAELCWPNNMQTDWDKV